jgi:chromosome segregation ATPase
MVSPKTQRNYTILQKKGKFFRLDSKKSVFSLFEKGPMYNKEKEQREKELEQTVETLKQTVQTLEQNLEGLKGQLEEERKMQEKAAQARANAIEMNPEVRELLDNLEQDPIFYHKLMLNFQEHKLEKKQLEESSKKKTGRKT